MNKDSIWTWEEHERKSKAIKQSKTKKNKSHKLKQLTYAEYKRIFR